MTNGTRWPTSRRVHASLEVPPTLVSDVDLALSDLGGALRKDMQQDDESPRSTVQHAIQLSTVMAAQLAQLPLHLRGMRKQEMRHRVAQQIQAAELPLDRGLSLIVQGVYELAHRLAT